MSSCALMINCRPGINGKSFVIVLDIIKYCFFRKMLYSFFRDSKCLDFPFQLIIFQSLTLLFMRNFLLENLRLFGEGSYFIPCSSRIRVISCPSGLVAVELFFVFSSRYYLKKNNNKILMQSKTVL